MCNPAAIGAVVTVFSTAITVQQQRKASKYRAGVDRYNARETENQAQKNRNAATERENDIRQKTVQLIAKQRAQLGAANVDLGSGSALQLQEDAATTGEADALRIRSGSDDQFESSLSQSDLLSNRAGFTESNINANTAGTVLSGAANVAGTGVADKWFTPKSSAITSATNDTAQIGL